MRGKKGGGELLLMICRINKKDLQTQTSACCLQCMASHMETASTPCMVLILDSEGDCFVNAI